MTFKRIAVSLCTIIIFMMMFVVGYLKTADINSYAAPNWQNVTDNEKLVQAFRAYCKSRDLTIEGSLADGVTTFTTNAFNGICNNIGIDVTALQAHLKYETDGNNCLKFLFDSTGISIYNRIFSQFLQDNDLSVGDNTNKQVYNGGLANDGRNKSLIWIVYKTGTASSPTELIKCKGIPYIYDYNYDYQNVSNLDFSIIGINQIGLTQGSNNLAKYQVVYATGHNASILKSLDPNYLGTKGCTILFRIEGQSKVQLGTYSYYFSGNNHNPAYSIINLNAIPGSATNLTVVNCTINLNTNNNTINNNNYTNQTTINNNGDIVTIPDDPEVPEYDPYPDGGGTTTPEDEIGGGDQSDDTNITFPNFEFNFPEIDWSIGDLSDKFPFSIPFDLISFFTVLNAEPEAPRIDANIPLGTWYTWHFRADFSQFDNYASIIRHVEFISFVVGLIYLTIRIVKG